MRDKRAILIVDTNVSLEKSLIEALRNDYLVVGAIDSTSAFLELDRNSKKFSLILLDFDILKKDNYGFIKKIRNISGLSNIPVIVTTRELGVNLKKS